MMIIHGNEGFVVTIKKFVATISQHLIDWQKTVAFKKNGRSALVSNQFKACTKLINNSLFFRFH